MRIAMAQVDCDLGSIEANEERARDVLADARGRGADLTIFPELSLTGYSIGHLDDDLAMRADDARLAALAAVAGDTDVCVGFPELSEGLHVYNSMAYFEAGELAHVHRKLYLPTYGPFEERKHFVPGQSIRAFPTRHGRVAILTCNDAWQPQLAFIAVQDAARILVVPAASSATQPDRPWDSSGYWRDITRFYARMFQVFVVFVNRVGSEGDFDFWGGSHVVDPWGRVVAEAAEDEEDLVVAEIDLDDVRRRRREIPLQKEPRLAMLAREFGRLVDEGGDL